jgi:hypothetical protein
MTQKIFEDILLFFFRHQLKIKMYHFQTKSYGAHKASDSYLSEFEQKLDKFMEVAQGIVGKLELKKIKLELFTLDDQTITDELDLFIKTLGMFDKVINKYSELLNIRDEMVADAKQLKYLLTFK